MPEPEPQPSGWPPSWPVLVPLPENLRRVWMTRFGAVMAEAQALDREATQRRADGEHYASEAKRKQERIDRARRTEWKTPPAFVVPGEPSAARAVGRLRLRQAEALLRSRRAAPPGQGTPEAGPQVVTLDDVLRKDVGKPYSETEIQQRFATLIDQYQHLIKRLDTAEQESAGGTP